ncbi:19081_t:CDS:2, partial [Gigaspora rosea]
IVVEWAKNGGKKPGHWAKDCRSSSRRDRRRSRSPTRRRSRSRSPRRSLTPRRDRSRDRDDRYYRRYSDDERSERRHSGDRRLSNEVNKRRTDAKGTKPNNYNTKKLRNTKSADNQGWQWTMISLQKRCQWTLSIGPMDSVHWANGHSPLGQWTCPLGQWT